MKTFIFVLSAGHNFNNELCEIVRAMHAQDCDSEGGSNGALIAALLQVDNHLTELKELIMATKEELLKAISDSQAEVKQHITDTAARVTADLNKLTATIADLQTKVGETLTQADVDKIVAADKDLVTSVDAIDPASPPPNPAPTPTA